jgi:hypothetical protein
MMMQLEMVARGVVRSVLDLWSSALTLVNMLMQSICGGRATWERASGNDQFSCDVTAVEVEEEEDDDELLPEELLLHVMSFMDHPAHLCALAAVCRRWHRRTLSHSFYLWYSFLLIRIKMF